MGSNAIMPDYVIDQSEDANIQHGLLPEIMGHGKTQFWIELKLNVLTAIAVRNFLLSL